MDPMRAAFVALFAECQSPSHAGKTEIDAQQLPALKVAAAVQRQAGEVRERLLEAEMTEGGAEHRGRLERIHQTIDALDADARAFISLGRRLSLGLEQMERYAREVESEIDRHENAKGSTPT